MTFRPRLSDNRSTARTSTTGCVDIEARRLAKPPNFYPGTTGKNPKSVTQAELTDSGAAGVATVAAFVAIPATWKLINFGKGFGAAAEQIRRPFSTAFVVARDSAALCTKLISFSVRRPICRHIVGDEVSSSARFFGNCLHFFCSRKRLSASSLPSSAR